MVIAACRLGGSFRGAEAGGLHAGSLAAGRPRWRSDVLSRTMTIASGRGVAHGRRSELESEFRITLFPLS